MKIKIVIFSLLILFSVFINGCVSSGSTQESYTNQDYANQNNSDYPEYNVDDLNQYGYWLDIPAYGRCWRPSVVADWHPYNNGHWAYDGNDWVWVSYEPFGWIVYHYGYWEDTPEYGWIWIPADDQWSPARVQWCDYGDVIGWVPMRPANRTWPEPWENGGRNEWTVVRKQDFTNENPHNYRVTNVSRNENIRVVHRAPEVKNIQQYVRQPIQVVKINRVPVQGNPVSTNGTKPPVQNDNTRKINPPVVRNNDNTSTTKTRGGKQIYNIQIPPQEKEKVDRNRPKVEKNVLVKKEPKQQPKDNNPKPKDDENQKKKDQQK